jgi:hypothetical protein
MPHDLGVLGGGIHNFPKYLSTQRLGIRDCERVCVVHQLRAVYQITHARPPVSCHIKGKT